MKNKKENKKKAIIYKDEEGYWGEILDLPGFLCYGTSKEDVKDRLREWTRKKYNQDVTFENLGKSLYIRDPIYNYIEIDAPLTPIINPRFSSEEVLFLQRLRYIKQNGLAYLVYPSLNTTRFEHSIGTMQLAKKVIDSIFTNSDDETIKQFVEDAVKQLIDKQIFDKETFDTPNKFIIVRKILKLISCYLALFHDIGQLPFSHTLESAIEEFLEDPKYNYEIVENKTIKTKYHELFSLEIIAGKGTGLFHSKNYKEATLLCLLSEYKENLENSIFATLKKIVSSEVDIDRGDFTQRDGYMSGSNFGIFDIDRVIRSFKLQKGDKKYGICIDSKGLRAVESLLVERYKVYKTLAYHHKVIFFNLILKDLFKEMLDEDKIITKMFDEYEEKEKNNSKDIEGPFLIIKNKNGKLFRFKPEFFIHPDDNSLYFDDAYILKEISKKYKNKLFADIILNRRSYSHSLWKREADFREIRKKILQKIANEINKSILIPIEEKDLNKFLIKLREGKDNRRHMFKLFREFCETFQEKLKEIKYKESGKIKSLPEIQVLITYSDPTIFGNISNILILNDSESSQSIIKLSKMLEEINELPNEIGYYIFVVSKEIPELKQKIRDEKINDENNRLIEKLNELIMPALESALQEVITDFIEKKTEKFEELVWNKSK
ncbi:hypothetical protein NLC26_01870 [Candidatus Aminicenantes bacterium AC-708-M15]|jgi:hypothetical protein|nr:hypothetical protein [SCandidatus Aminicenantes bacterium Aminicenantia_JdfR_composite]MCP2604210.1 hypothetical protein [Candidatus Aminicenantes bacterium AC-708-M15]MCP2606370.1 hypothetical protein [Candidatus Aminicenantes bacterium AC-708-I09]MCP2618622.1 hypothetical protein [Candidatus Aminicenantes bacterium AC-335-A11]MCP2620977.1 hypothetical protein [Candidatus Aminicenantes bacterium AC-334-E05]